MKISLSAARVNAGYRQADVAAILDKQPATVSAWETGASDMSAKTYLDLCELYGIQPGDLILP